MSEGVTQPASPSGTPTPAAPLPANPSTLVQPLAGSATPVFPVRKFKRERGRLTGIQIENYRAFNGPFQILLPQGENALIYGENGAGKSSLFHSIRDFLEAPQAEFLERNKPEDEGQTRELRLADNQHRPKKGDPKIQLEFEHGQFTWDLTEDAKRKNGPWDPIISATSKGKGFLDYRALLRIHFLPGRDGARIDLFDLMLRSLLPSYTYFHADRWEEKRHGGASGSGERTFAQGWSDVERRADEWHGSIRWPAFKSAQKAFDEALKKQIEDQLAAKASEIAKRFDPALEIRFKVEASDYSTIPRKKISPPRIYIYLPPTGDRGQVIDYDRFFNEARLTAIAMSIFFAALLQSPATGQRLLALDDILIGLDMANRLTVLRILEKYFKDWQVLIFTYHKAWFEILKERTASASWKYPWKHFVIRQEQNLDERIAFVKADESKPMLDLADRYANSGEHKSAAVHARTAMEIVLSRVCAKRELPVRFVQSQNSQTNHDFLSAIHKWLSHLRSPIVFAHWENLKSELNQSLRSVLHSYSHRSPEREDELAGEVREAINTVRRLEVFLASIKKSHLLEESIPVRTCMGLLDEAQSFAISKDHIKALRALKHACEAWLLDETERRGITVRLVEDEHPWALLFRALTPSEKRAVGKYQRYFLGKVKPKEFVPGDFALAVDSLKQLIPVPAPQAPQVTAALATVPTVAAQQQEATTSAAPNVSTMPTTPSSSV